MNIKEPIASLSDKELRIGFNTSVKENKWIYLIILFVIIIAGYFTYQYCTEKQTTK